MNIGEAIGRVRKLSDDELLGSLRGALGTSRSLTALVLAHLAEVEERRLHQLAGCSSLFAYCTERLAMSEDEAFRRIRAARLARRFPGILELLASGQITLSVVALLDSLLTETNHAALLEAVSGKTVAQAREVLAAWFPRPDVLPFIRKLPTPPASVATARADVTSPPTPTTERVESPVDMTPSTTAPAPALEPPPSAASASQHPPDRTPPPPPCPRRPSSHVEPLSPQRYKVVFTADAELKRKLDLARDLLRHAVPSGDLTLLLGRALDLLIEKTLQRRFGKTDRPKTAEASEASKAPNPPAPSAPSGAASASIPADPPRRSSHLPNAVRRTVLERDGLRSTWRAPDGTRCQSRAWLEHDHIDPRGQGGTDNPETIRIRCRAHNRLAAEQTYGQANMTRIIARQRHARRCCDEPRVVLDTAHVEDRSRPGLR